MNEFLELSVRICPVVVSFGMFYACYTMTRDLYEFHSSESMELKFQVMKMNALFELLISKLGKDE